MDEFVKAPALPLPDAERAGVYRAIMTRRDTRGEYLPDPVSDETLSRLLVAAHHAPSVGYMQPWSFLVVRDQAVKRRVHDAFVKAHAEAALMFPEEKRNVYRSLKLEGIMESPVNICITCDRDRAGPVVMGARTSRPWTCSARSARCRISARRPRRRAWRGLGEHFRQRGGAARARNSPRTSCPSPISASAR